MSNTSVILLEFINDVSLYKRHYICLYSFSNDFGYDNFTKQLECANDKISKEIQSENNYNFEKIIEIQREFNSVPWTMPWIEFVNEEFISTVWPIIKENEQKEISYVFTKSFYLFIEEEELKAKFFNFLKKKLPYNANVYSDVMENHYFYQAEKFERPITFCIMMDLKNNLILKIEVHHFEAFFGDNSEESLRKQKNFYYFYKTLEGIKEDISNSMERLDDKSFIRRTVIDNLKNHAIFCI